MVICKQVVKLEAKNPLLPLPQSKKKIFLSDKKLETMLLDKYKTLEI